MKQGKIVSGLVMALVVAVVVYMAYYITQAVASPLKTAKAVLYTAEETVPVNGYFMRDELLVASGKGEVQELCVSEGHKVAKGEALYIGYDNAEVRQMRRELENVETRLALLKQAADGGGSSDIAKLDQDISEHLINVIYGVGQPKAVDTAFEEKNLKASVLERGLAYSATGGQEASAAIGELETQKKQLSQQAVKGVASVKAPDSGFFSSSVDGFEGILTLEKANTITLDELHNVERLKKTVAPNAYCGRLVTGFEWRLAAAVPAKYADKLTEGKTTTLRFSGDYIGQTPVTIRRISEASGGEKLVVFSSNTKISELLGLRKQSVEIIFARYDGIRIPKEALRINDSGETGVYCLVAMQARFFKTEQIYETDQAYIVKYDPTSVAGLRPGDEIIVSSKNLYDGKIIK